MRLRYASAMRRGRGRQQRQQSVDRRAAAAAAADGRLTALQRFGREGTTKLDEALHTQLTHTRTHTHNNSHHTIPRQNVLLT